MRLGVKEVVKLVKITWQVKHKKNAYVESINSQKTKKYHSLTDVRNYIQTALSAVTTMNTLTLEQRKAVFCHICKFERFVNFIANKCSNHGNPSLFGP